MDGAETISARLIAQAGKANRGMAQGQPRPLPSSHLRLDLHFHA